MPDIYEVGGYIRDELLGIPSKDRDYTFVLNAEEAKDLSIDEAFQTMYDWMIGNGYQIFLSTPEFLTIRAKDPRAKLVSDFVLARWEVGYIKGTRCPLVRVGTLRDDLLRRDFTINAIARDSKGELIDYHNGLDDLRNGILRTPLDPDITLRDDPLRVLRAIRFSIKLNFKMADDLWDALHNADLVNNMAVVSTDRIRDELTKAMRIDTWSTLELLNKLPKALSKCIFRDGLWLLPTTKQ